MHDQSRDELEQIAKIRRIKNYEEMSKEGLIIVLLKSKRSIIESFNNNTDNDRIREIKQIFNELGNRHTKKIQKKNQKKLYEIESKKNLSELEKEEINEYLAELVRILDKKEKYFYRDRDDLNYYGIKDIRNLFSEVDEKNYYKPILVKSSYKEMTKNMKVKEAEIYQ